MTIFKLQNSKTGERKHPDELTGCHILYVEDNEVNQYLAQQILKPWNVEIEFAENGKEAISRLEEKDFDLVLMDIQMPIMNGIEATKVIRNDNDLKSDIPIIGFTADIMMGTKIAAMKAGMNKIVMKPFDRDELYEIVTTLLEKQLSGQ
jgi:CheY-like chemotaxis protein